MAGNYQSRQKTPTEQVIEMQNDGVDDAEIITTLTNQGLSAGQITDALNQAKIKQAVTRQNIPAPEGLSPSIMSPQNPVQQREEVPMPGKFMEGQMPSEQYSGYEQQPSAGLDTEAIEEIAEGIISEKWEEARLKISSMTEWKDYADNRLRNVEGDLKRVKSSLDELQSALLGKVQKYSQDIKDLGTEVKSMQGAFSQVLSPLASNVQQLQRLTENLKTSRHHEPAEHHEHAEHKHPHAEHKHPHAEHHEHKVHHTEHHEPAKHVEHHIAKSHSEKKKK